MACKPNRTQYNVIPIVHYAQVSGFIILLVYFDLIVHHKFISLSTTSLFYYIGSFNRATKILRMN